MDVKTLTNDLVTDKIVPASAGAVGTVAGVAEVIDIDAVADTLSDAVEIVTDAGATGVRRISSIARSHPKATVAGFAVVVGLAAAVYLRRKAWNGDAPAQLEPVSEAA